MHEGTKSAFLRDARDISGATLSAHGDILLSRKLVSKLVQARVHLGTHLHLPDRDPTIDGVSLFAVFALNVFFNWLGRGQKGDTAQCAARGISANIKFQ